MAGARDREDQRKEILNESEDCQSLLMKGVYMSVCVCVGGALVLFKCVLQINCVLLCPPAE